MDRVALKGIAERAAATGDTSELFAAIYQHTRGMRKVGPPRHRLPIPQGELGDDARSIGYTAGMEAARNQLAAGVPDFKSIDAAIQNAIREHLRAGGYHADLARRGFYSSDERKFTSELGHEAMRAFEPDSEPIAVGETVQPLTEQPEETSIGGHVAEAALDAQAAAVEHKGSRADESGAEVTMAWVEDNDTADPTQDTDRECGIAGASKGLAATTGRIQPLPHIEAEADAYAELPPDDLKFLLAIAKTGSTERYIAQHRQKQAAEIRARHTQLAHRVKRRKKEILAEREKLGMPGTAPSPMTSPLLADWLGSLRKPSEPVQTAAVPKPAPVAPEPSYGPYTVTVHVEYPQPQPDRFARAQGPLWRLEVTGRSKAEAMRLAAEWRRQAAQDGSMSLLDLVWLERFRTKRQVLPDVERGEDWAYEIVENVRNVLSVVSMRRAPVNWGAPIIAVTASLLDG